MSFELSSKTSSQVGLISPKGSKQKLAKTKECIESSFQSWIFPSKERLMSSLQFLKVVAFVCVKSKPSVNKFDELCTVLKSPVKSR